MTNVCKLIVFCACAAEDKFCGINTYGLGFTRVLVCKCAGAVVRNGQ